MAAPINPKLLRLCAVIGLYICLASGSAYILHGSDTGSEISQNVIVANEAKAKNYLKLIYHAQNRYIAVDWDKDGIKRYAEFMAHLWQTVDHNANPVRTSFISRKLAFAMGVSRALDGYYFSSIHTKEIQPGGSNSDKCVKERQLQPIDIDLTQEWAIVAAPASYGRTGTLSFIVGNTGKIYARDLGNRPVNSLPESFLSVGWQEIVDIR